MNDLIIPQIVIPDFNIGLGIGFILGIVFILLIGFYFRPKDTIEQIGVEDV